MEIVSELCPVAWELKSYRFPCELACCTAVKAGQL